jgi:hypothetical protein
MKTYLVSVIFKDSKGFEPVPIASFLNEEEANRFCFKIEEQLAIYIPQYYERTVVTPISCYEHCHDTVYEVTMPRLLAERIGLYGN